MSQHRRERTVDAGPDIAIKDAATIRAQFSDAHDTRTAFKSTVDAVLAWLVEFRATLVSARSDYAGHATTANIAYIPSK